MIIHLRHFFALSHLLLTAVRALTHFSDDDWRIAGMQSDQMIRAGLVADIEQNSIELRRDMVLECGRYSQFEYVMH